MALWHRVRSRDPSAGPPIVAAPDTRRDPAKWRHAWRPVCIIGQPPDGLDGGLDRSPIDLFCCNAGVGAGPELSSPDSEWQLAWGVNVMAHVYAARHLVPRMLARGGGYFLNTSSAAGLLSQIGNAAYATTKHAAVGFAEWLAISYGHRGIKVSLLCPQAVRTPMTQNDANASVQAAAGDGMMEPEELAECVIEGLRQESFLILTHGQVVEYMRRKTADYDRWIRGMNRLHQRLVDGEG
jgi:NAD(P)-dependent dehydrogenase (short-subunit alcohol dehydrogenase family)